MKKQIDYLNYPYPSQRTPVFAPNGAVASSQPLAAHAGLRILLKGGNAIDAALATAATLTVVEPTSNGIGGDAFALFWADGKLHGINGSGKSPSNISIKKVKDRGYDKIPKYGWIPVTVPGIPGTWAKLSKKFGRLPLTEVIKPAIEYAEKGFPLSPVTGKYWNYAYKRYKNNLKGEQFSNWFSTFAPKGRAPKIGEMWNSPYHARTLQKIAETNAESFYKGEIAEKIDNFSRQYNGFLRGEDLADFEAEWINPLNINYRGYDVWELPPNGQGLIALMALGILNEMKVQNKENPETYHKQIEALKLAMIDGKKYITDIEKMSKKPVDLLAENYLKQRRKKIGKKAIKPEPGHPPGGGTVYLAAADSEGNMISYIQSNYMGFGSGLVVPDTGIALQNRGHLFSLDPDHDNALECKKKTYHTIIPGFLTKDNRPIGPFGVMGGYMQPQGHLQVISNTIDHDLNPQAALDAPRWQWVNGKKIKVEHHFPRHIAQKLSRMGHQIEVSLDSGSFGRGQLIWQKHGGSYVAGTEPRTDGSIASY